MARPRRLRRRHPASGPVALSGRVALVTGAARGIGRVIALALALAREGADIACADLLPAEDTARAVRALGRRAIALRVDIGRAAHERRMIADTARRLGGLDILVNNAGIAQRDSLEGTSEKTWDRVVGVVLKGTFLCCHAVAPAALSRRPHGAAGGRRGSRCLPRLRRLQLRHRSGADPGRRRPNLAGCSRTPRLLGAGAGELDERGRVEEPR